MDGMLDVAAWIFENALILFSYISGQSSFPKTLTPEEERMYLERLAQGDEKARDALIEHNLRLVAHVIKKYTNTGKEIEDLISIGTIGLIKGVSTYDMNKGTQLATYVARCIENEILMSIRASKKPNQSISLNDPIGTDRDGNEMSLMDILHTQDDSVTEEVERKLQAAKVRRMIRTALTKRERVVIELRYGLRSSRILTQREIARLLGISRSYVSRIEKRALQKLCKKLNEGGD
ncbi:MAG: RNA polymerase sporulation sigma factor SigK [Clostridiales bacterium]|jgi:RNA polymerase sporulation-specific sigma factor|nr:RNA polymerase sporulation sigma factor SigK [Clostridiales bacterium]